MKQTKTVSEQISALADGQLQGEEFAKVIADLGSDARLRETWHTYHLVGDVLRAGDHAPCSDADGFMSRLQQRLAAETVVRAPIPVVVPVPRVVEAANEPVFRWKLVAGAASLAAAAAIGWTWVGSNPAPAGPQLALQQQQQLQPQQPADAPNSVLAAAGSPASGRVASPTTRVIVGNGSDAAVMLRDPRLDELLEAHQQAGGASQMPSGFLRNATFDAPSR